MLKAQSLKQGVKLFISRLAPAPSRAILLGWAQKRPHEGNVEFRIQNSELRIGKNLDLELD